MYSSRKNRGGIELRRVYGLVARLRRAAKITKSDNRAMVASSGEVGEGPMVVEVIVGVAPLGVGVGVAVPGVTGPRGVGSLGEEVVEGGVVGIGVRIGVRIGVGPVVVVGVIGGGVAMTVVGGGGPEVCGG